MTADRLVDASQPAEVYYLAAHHRSSEDESENAVLGFARSFDVHVKGLLHFLERHSKALLHTQSYSMPRPLMYSEIRVMCRKQKRPPLIP